jgi:hypothetical protein
MLHLKTHHQFHLPHIRTQSLQLSAVQSDDDELLYDLDNAVDIHDDNWTLDASRDTHQLTTFWSGVEEDLKKDPSWFQFDDE